MPKVGNFLEKITDPMPFMIIVAKLVAGSFVFLWEFEENLYFLDYPPTFLGASRVAFKKEPLITNSKMAA